MRPGFRWATPLGAHATPIQPISLSRRMQSTSETCVIAGMPGAAAIAFRAAAPRTPSGSRLPMTPHHAC